MNTKITVEDIKQYLKDEGLISLLNLVEEALLDKISEQSRKEIDALIDEHNYEFVRYARMRIQATKR